MFSFLSPDLDPMPDAEISMFQMDRSEFVTRLFGRVTHCKEISLCFSPGWEMVSSYGEWRKTPFGDFAEINKTRALYEASPILCAWKHPESATVLAISRFPEKSVKDIIEIEEAIASSILPTHTTLELNRRDLRPIELRLVKGRTPVELLSAKLNYIEGRVAGSLKESTARLFTAVYESHAQPGVYALSALVPVPVAKPLHLMREISYSFSRFWILPRPYADGTLVRRPVDGKKHRSCG